MAINIESRSRAGGHLIAMYQHRLAGFPTLFQIPW